MKFPIFFLIIFFVKMLKVNMMALNGPVLTTYHPCGVGLVHFDRLAVNNWRGILNFGLYDNLMEAEVVMTFKDETTITADLNAYNVTAIRTNKHNLVIQTTQPMPHKFIFYVTRDHLILNETDVPTVANLTLNNITLCNDEIKASQTVTSFNVTQRYSSHKYAHVCGRRSLDHEEVVSVRTEARAGDWPWHVAIFIKDMKNDVLNYDCGGNIVSKTAILTGTIYYTTEVVDKHTAHLMESCYRGLWTCATPGGHTRAADSVNAESFYALRVEDKSGIAFGLPTDSTKPTGHCVFKASALLATNRIVIVAGSSKVKDFSHVGRQARNAQEIILHPSYTDEYSTDDLAIIKVLSLEFTEYVQPICLWGPVYDKSSLFGKEATVVGFGSTEFNKQSETLRSTYTMVQNDTICVTFSPLIYAKLLNEFTLCAGYGPTSSINPRNGDSGGGLVIPAIQYDHKVSWFLRGILSKCGVSPGNVQCDPKYYVVYTDVAPHYGWIYHHAGLQYRSNVLFT